MNTLMDGIAQRNLQMDIHEISTRRISCLGRSKRLLIVGAGWAGQTIAPILLKMDPKSLVGFVDDRSETKAITVFSNNSGVPISVLGHSKDLVAIVKEHNVDGVVIAVTSSREDHLLSQIVKCYEEDIQLFEMPDLYADLTGKVPVQHINHHWIVPNLTGPKAGYYDLFHNATNYLLSLLGFFLVFIPIFPILALAIKLDSKGPIFFHQVRAGRRGKPFTLFKFRTMVENASTTGDAWTNKYDERITRLGRFLRMFRIDELPQLINVLKRDMALIGPRPEAVELVDIFRKEIPFYEYRYLVKPGITGWAQVNYENTCSVAGALEKLQYDLYWIKNRSFWLDLKIIFKSIKVMLTGFGAV